MRNLSLILFILIFTCLSVPAFADQGPLKFPMREGSNASAHKHNEEGISHYNQGHYDVALKHFQMASKVDSSVGASHIIMRRSAWINWGNTERQQIISTLRGNTLKEILPFLDLRFSMLMLP